MTRTTSLSLLMTVVLANTAWAQGPTPQECSARLDACMTQAGLIAFLSHLEVAGSGNIDDAMRAFAECMSPAIATGTCMTAQRSYEDLDVYWARGTISSTLDSSIAVATLAGMGAVTASNSGVFASAYASGGTSGGNSATATTTGTPGNVACAVAGIATGAGESGGNATATCPMGSGYASSYGGRGASRAAGAAGNGGHGGNAHSTGYRPLARGGNGGTANDGNGGNGGYAYCNIINGQSTEGLYTAVGGVGADTAGGNGGWGGSVKFRRGTNENNMGTAGNGGIGSGTERLGGNGGCIHQNIPGGTSMNTLGTRGAGVNGATSGQDGMLRNIDDP